MFGSESLAVCVCALCFVRIRESACRRRRVFSRLRNHKMYRHRNHQQYRQPHLDHMRSRSHRNIVELDGSATHLAEIIMMIASLITTVAALTFRKHQHAKFVASGGLIMIAVPCRLWLVSRCDYNYRVSQIQMESFCQRRSVFLGSQIHHGCGDELVAMVE